MILFQRSLLSMYQARHPRVTSRHVTPFQFVWIYHLFGLLLLLAGIPGVRATCPTVPSGCTCVGGYPVMGGSKMYNISCVDLELSSFPIFSKDADTIYMLDLSNNCIPSIAASDFTYFTEVVELNLSYNCLTSVTSGVFSSMTNLQYLTLEGNMLDTIPSVLHSRNSLLYLDLSHLQLTTFPTDTVEGLDQLIEIDVSNNQISSLEQHAFRNSNLQRINLAGNQLTQLDNKDFHPSKSTSVTELNLSYNHLTTLNPDVFDNIGNLQILDLSHNQFSELDKSMFQSVTSLTVLELSGNLLSVVDKDLFNNLKQMTALSLSGNNIGTLDEELLEDLTSLTYLDLSYNSIVNIRENHFNRLKNLVELDLHDNKIFRLKDNYFTALTSLTVMDISYNPLTCQCSHKEVLYNLRYRSTPVQFPDEDNIKCTYGTSEYILLDWDDNTCDGYLGSDCTENSQCHVRHSECNTTSFPSVCDCSTGYYDTNDVQNIRGLCEEMVSLGFHCTTSAACLVPHAKCIDNNCTCLSGFYEDLEGTCQKSLALGEACTASSQCDGNNVECNSSQVCACLSTHYDNMQGAGGGTCVQKKDLGENCSWSDQCATSNSECSNNLCSCATNYYSLDGSTCQKKPGRKRALSSRTKRTVDLKRLCRHLTHRPVGFKCAIGNFFSCYANETSGGNEEVHFTHVEPKASDESCKVMCYNEDKRYYIFKNNLCLCGNIASTASCSCPSTSCIGGKLHLDNVQYATAGLVIGAFPQLVAGTSYTFTATVTLSSISTVTYWFGDSETNVTTGFSTAISFSHTYTRSGKFDLTVMVCCLAGVCDKVVLPVIVQSRYTDATIRGWKQSDFAKKYDASVIFTQGFKLQYYWTRMDSNGNIKTRRQCPVGWTTHREMCLNFLSVDVDYSTASSMCAGSSGRLLSFDHMAQINEIRTALSLTTETFYTCAEKVSGNWVWTCNGNQPVYAFSDSDLTSPTTGSHVVIDGSSLTTVDSSSTNAVVCVKDPEDCQYGGILHTDGRCFVLETKTKNWQDANDFCNSEFGGTLAVIEDSAAHAAVNLAVNDITSMAWIGLSDRNAEGIYQFVDDSMFDDTYSPFFGDITHDCVVTTSSNQWQSKDCNSELNSVCQYHTNREEVTVWSYQTGNLDMEFESNTDLDILTPTAAFNVTTTSTTIILFPGFWFSRTGTIRDIIFKSSDNITAGETWNIAFQVYRPTCTSGNFVRPGLGSEFASCDSGTHSYTHSSCPGTQTLCYLSNSCQDQSAYCSCAADSTYDSCGTYHIGNMPTYKLVGQTKATVTSAKAGRSASFPADISVIEHDVVAIQVETNRNPFKCDVRGNAKSDQMTYISTTSTNYFQVKDDPFPSASKTDLRQTCYFQVIYTEDITLPVPDVLAYVSTSGIYMYSITVPYFSVSKNLSVEQEELIGDITWLYPPISESSTSASTVGVIYVKTNVTTYFVLRITTGTNVIAVFSFDYGNQIDFTSTCPAAVATALPEECDESLVRAAAPFAYTNHTVTSSGISQLDITISSSFDSPRTVKVTVNAQAVISGVTLTCTSSSATPIIVAKDRSTICQADVTEGTEMTFNFIFNNSVVSSSVNQIQHTFTETGTYVASVNVSNAHGFQISSVLEIQVLQPANLRGCEFTSTSIIAAVSVDIDLEVICSVEIGASVTVLWTLGVTSSSTAETTKTEATNVSFKMNYTYTNTGVYNVTVVITDPFDTVVLQTNVNVYNSITDFSVSATKSSMCLFSSTNFKTFLPEAPSNYGPVTYQWDFGDGSSPTTEYTGSISRTFTTTGTFNVAVVASNGVSSNLQTTTVSVAQEIPKNFTVSYSDAPTLIGEETRLAASLTWSDVTYSFSSSQFNSSVSTLPFKYSFNSTGSYVVTVNASNDCNFAVATVTVVVVNASHLEILSLSIQGDSSDDCIATNIVKTYVVSVLHHDRSGLDAEWNFDDGTVVNGGLTMTHTFSLARSADYSVQVTVTDTNTSISKSTSKQMCVQEEVSNPSFIISNPIGLPSTGVVSKSLTAVVDTGFPRRYFWSTNATSITDTTSQMSIVTFTSVGIYQVQLQVYNDVSSETKTEVVVVAVEIEGLSISCTLCPYNCPTCVQSMVYYAKTGLNYTFEASVLLGDGVYYNIDFGDGISASSNLATHSYSSAGSYTVTVTGSNAVTSVATASMRVDAEDEVSGVVVTSSGDSWISGTDNEIQSGEPARFVAKVSPSGVSTAYVWKFSDDLPAEAASIDNTGSHIFNTAGEYTCSVTAQNSISLAHGKFQFCVLENITSVVISYNDTGEHLAPKSYVSVGSSHIFRAIPNSDFRINYEIKIFKNSVFSGYSEKNTFEYRFNMEDNYLLTATVRNNIPSSASVSIAIDALFEIENPMITPSGDGNRYIKKNTSITFTASQSAGSSPQYSWSLKSGPAGAPTLSSSSNAVTYTPTVEGTYIVEVSIGNELGAKNATNSLQVQEEVSSLHIGDNIGQNRFIPTGMSVTFFPSFTGSEPNYSWSISLGGKIMQTGAVADFVMAFIEQGEYTLTLTVFNQVSSMTVTRTVIALNLVLIFSVSVTGTVIDAGSHYVQTNTIVYFSIDVTDTDFLTVNWTLDGAKTSGVSTTFSYTLTSPGTYSLEVTVFNSIDSHTETLTIEALDPITNLNVAACRIDHKANKDIILTANYSTGTGVTVKWTFPDQGSRTGPTTTLQYAASAQYSGTVTASNKIDIQIYSCILRVLGNITNLVLAASEHKFTDHEIIFTLTGNNLALATRQWQIVSLGVDQTDALDTFTHTFTVAGTYTVIVTVYNTFSRQSVSVTVTVQDLGCSHPELKSDASSNRTSVRGIAVEFDVTVTTNGCTNYASTNSWILYQSSLVYPLPNSVSTNTPRLVIPEATLDYGTYLVVFQVSYANTPVTKTMQFTLTVESSALYAVMAGGSSLRYPAGSSFPLDASLSHDGDEAAASLSYSWQCSDSGTAPDFCTKVRSVTTATHQITDVTLTPGMVFTLEVTVSSPGRTSGSATQQVTIIDADSALIVTVRCVSCKTSGFYNVTSQKSISLTGSCVDSDGICSSNSTAYIWKLINKSSNREVTLRTSDTSTGINSINLVVYSGVLEDNKDYDFTLIATSGTRSGTASVSLFAGSIPSGGSCSITSPSPSPVSIIPLLQTITCLCAGWADPNTKTLYYKYVARSGSDEYIISFDTQAENTLVVSPFPGTSSIEIYVYILNDYGVGPSVKAGTVIFQTPSLAGDQTMVDHLMSLTDSLLLPIVHENNPNRLVQFCISFLLILNEESSSGNSGQLAERMAIRDIVITAFSGLLELSLRHTDIQQLSTALQLLTEEPSEIQTQETQQIVFSLVGYLTSVINPQQGHDRRDFELDGLFSAILSVNVANSQVSSVTSSASSHDKVQYLMEISHTVSTLTYTSTQWQEQLKLKTLQYTEDLIFSLLETQLAGEQMVQYTKQNSLSIEGRRVTVENIHQEYSTDKALLIIPDEVVAKVSSAGSEFFQLTSFAPSDSLNINTMPGSPVTSVILTSSITTTDKIEVPINNLSDLGSVKMYISSSEITTFSVTSSGSNTRIQDSDGYDATLGMQYATIPLTANEEVELHGFEKSETTDVSAHFQLRVTFHPDSPDAQLTATLGSTVKIITAAMMSGGHTDYTFFLEKGVYDNTVDYKIKVRSNAKATLQYGQYFTSCQFYNRSLSLWQNSGCKPLDESILTISVCSCNHSTSYGASALLAPTDIDFTDLTRLDIASNPVAIIISSVILGLYIGVVILCWRLDRQDIKRISSKPLCGKDGSHKYEVTVVTGRQLGAGTTANVGARLIGDYHKTAYQHLYKQGAFQRNCADTFIVAHDMNLGELQKVIVWHDNRGRSPSWYLSYLIVKDLQTDKKYYFFADSWLTLEKDNGYIQKEMKAAGPAEMQRFSRRMKTAMFNSFADKHLWLSLVNRPALSRFTRVQRATCCVTLLYTFIGVNAMWYGLLRQDGNAIGWSTYGWEEVILAIISNLMVFPINIGIIYLFKKSKSKSNVFDHVIKPGTAQTLEIDNMCENSNAGSFQESSFFPEDLERESTFGSLPANVIGGALRRTKPVSTVHREKTDDSIRSTIIPSGKTSQKAQPMWNPDSIMKWPDSVPITDDAESRPSTVTGSGVRQPPSKGGGSTAPSASTSNDSKKPASLRRPTMHQSDWKDLEDIFNSDDESTVAESSQGRSLKKRMSTNSTTSCAGQSQFNPREEPRINNDRSGRRPHLFSRESVASSRLGGESVYSSEHGITAGLRPGYYSEMTIEEQNQLVPVHKEKCTLPFWCVYVAYFLCFVLSAFSIIVVILYCFKFGYEESVEWILAFLLSLLQSLFLVEPLKAIFFAVYLVALFKRVEEDEDEDVIDFEPSLDTSNEKIKDVKFKPVSGFALMQAKEEGRRIQRMHALIHQFIAYLFYLWLLMVICYVNFHQNSYYFTKSVEIDFINTTTSNFISFTNISTTSEFWEWSENVLSESLYLYDSEPEEEHGYLLGVARMRQTRGTTVKCQAEEVAAGYGVPALTQRTCYGDSGFSEDTRWYGEGWNESTQNLSWRFFSGTELGSTEKLGYMASYSGGGYVQTLGTSHAESLTILQNLQANDWINLRTRAVMIEFAMYSPGSDMTAVTTLMAEFPVTGSVITSYETHSQKLLWFQEGRFDPLVIFEILLLLVAVYSTVHIALMIHQKRRSYFKDLWNWYEMLTTLMTITSVGMYIGCVVEATNTFNHMLDNQATFTNYERVSTVHVVARNIHAWLLFLLFFKVVKQLRFIRFLHVYERTLSKAVGLLLGTGLIFFILLLAYALVGHLMYGRIVTGFESVGTSLSTLTVIIRGSFDFWPLLDHQPVFSHFYLYSYYAFVYGLTVALVIAILTNTYKTVRNRMYFRSTLSMQDHEMVDFMMKRFKLWAGITKPKPAFRSVKFEGLPSISSRPSSSNSTISSTSSSSSCSWLMTGPEYSSKQLTNMVARLEPTWHEVLRRFERIEKIEADEERQVRKAEEQMSDLNWKIKINRLEQEHRDILSWTTNRDKPPLDPKSKQLGVGAKAKILQTRKAPATVSGASRVPATPPANREKVDQGRRPLSDQGARAENAPVRQSETNSTEKFLRSIKPSRPAWDK